jgi:Tol biopolymer transport system component
MAAVIVAVVGAIWFARSTAKAPEAPLTAVPLTTYPGFQEDPTFSPDGNQVAFSWNGEKQDNFDIYVKLIGTGAPPLRLTTDPASDISPAWSPDGRFIAFLRRVSPATCAVLLIPALGGPERKITTIAVVSQSMPSRPYLEWLPDGKWLVISDRASREEPAALYLLSPETGEKRRLTTPPAHSLGDGAPAVSPDGDALVFSRDADTPVGELYLLSLSAELKPVGEPQQLTRGNRGFGRPTWTPDGHAVVFSFGGLGQQGLWKIAASRSEGRTPEPQRLVSLGNNLTDAVISRHGRRLVYAHNLFHWNIWRMAAPVNRNARNAKSPEKSNDAVLFISSTRDDSSPQFSPDGKRIAFVSDRSGNAEIWVCGSDGSNALQITSFGGPDVTTPRWSPDGERIAFDSNAAGEFDVWVVSANGGKTERMTTHPANDGDPSWSRDGRWIYFDSHRTGQQQVFKIPANGGDAIQVTRDGGFAPLESPDGKFLYYTKALQGTSLWKVPTEGGQAVKVLDGLSSYINLAMAADRMYFVPLRSGGRTRGTADTGDSIQFLDFGTGQIRLVANVAKPFNFDAGAGGLAVSPDGRWILYTQFDQAGSELMLAENFR